jgi:hypothetical protein
LAFGLDLARGIAKENPALRRNQKPFSRDQKPFIRNQETIKKRKL